MSVLQSQLRLTVFDGTRGPLRAISAQLSAFSARARAMTSMFSGLSGRIAMLTGGAASIYGVARGFTSALDTAGSFEKSMNQLRVVSGATGSQFDAMRKQALELGRTTQYTASQAGEAQNFLAMAGLRSNDILGAMPGTLQLAAAAQMDLGKSADIVTNILTGYGMEVDQLGRVNDVLVKAFTSANTDLADLGTAFKYAGSIARTSGVEFEEAAAVMALMGNAGYQGSMAGTALRGSLSRLARGTPAVTKAMKRAGVQFKDTEGRLLPLADIIERLEPHAENTKLMMDLFGDRAGPAMAALISQGSAAVRKLTQDLRNSEGSAKSAAAVQMEGWEGAKRAMWSAYEGFQIAFGQRAAKRFTPYLQSLTAAFGELTAFIESLDKRISVFDKMKAAFDAFAVGMGGTGFTSWLSETGAAWRDSIFGKEFGEGEFEAVNNLARISNQWREIGRNFRAFMDDMSAGNLSSAMGGLWDAFKGMPTFGKMVALFAMAKGISLLSASLVMLASSPWVRGVLALYGIARVIELFQGAESFSAFVDSLKELSAIEWAGIGAGILLLLGPLKLVSKAAGAATRALRGLLNFGKKAAPATAAAASRATGGAPAKSAPATVTPGLNAKIPKGFQSPWAAKPAPAVLPARGPTGSAIPRAPVPAPMMEFPSAAPVATGVGAALKSFFGKGGLIGMGLLAGGEYSIASTLEQLNKWLYTDEQRAKADELLGTSRRKTWLGNEVTDTPSLFENLRRLDGWLSERFPSLRANVPGQDPSLPATAPVPASRPETGMFQQFLDGMDKLAPQSDPLPTLESIRDAVGRAPTGTHEVREINPTPVHAPINVTVYATTMADAGQIAAQVGAKVQDTIAGYYGTSAYS